jgi:hypothetical protein
VLGQGLASLRRLRLMDVTSLTDDGLISMLCHGRMTALEELCLSGCNKVRGNVVRHVCSRFPALKVLRPCSSSCCPRPCDCR